MHSRGADRPEAVAGLETGQVSRKCSVVIDVPQTAQTALSRIPILCRLAFLISSAICRKIGFSYARADFAASGYWIHGAASSGT